MLARDRPALLENPGEKTIQCQLRPFADFEISEIPNHEIRVDIPVSGMAETRDRDSRFALESLGKLDECYKLRARDNDVFVELHQPSISEGK